MNKIDPQIERVLTEREVLMRLDNEDHQRPIAPSEKEYLGPKAQKSRHDLTKRK